MQALTHSCIKLGTSLQQHRMRALPHQCVGICVQALLPGQLAEAMEGHLHILVTVHLQDVAPLLVNDQAAHHIPIVKLKIHQLLQGGNHSHVGKGPLY